MPKRTAWNGFLETSSGLFFFSACGGCCWVLRVLGEPMAWVFLLGLLPAAPVAIVTARLLRRGARPWLFSLLVIAGYTTLFWGAIGLQAVRTALME